MESRFRAIIFGQIEDSLQQEPSAEALLNLLKIAKPDLKDDDDFRDESNRTSAFRELKLLIHPDKQKDDSKERAQDLFQRAQNFYDDCMENFNKPSARKKTRQSSSPRSVSNLGHEFHVKNKWPFPDIADAQQSRDFVDTMEEEEAIHIGTAYKCINFRGAIAHGRSTELQYGVGGKECSETTTQDIFTVCGKGYKTLESVDEIKEELMTRGPVVSIAFELTQEFVNASEYGHLFFNSQIGATHPVLILGWKLSSFGEMWIIQTTRGNTEFPIGFRQFGIDDVCIAPNSDFSDCAWQGGDKIFSDVSLTNSDWYSWPGMLLKLSSEDFENLMSTINESILHAVDNKTEFVLRETPKIARSRTAFLVDITWDGSAKKWGIQMNFVF